MQTMKIKIKDKAVTGWENTLPHPLLCPTATQLSYSAVNGSYSLVVAATSFPLMGGDLGAPNRLLLERLQATALGTPQFNRDTDC